MADKILRSYLARINDVASQGDAREESYYSALEELLKGHAQSTCRKDIHVTTLPKKTEAGNPDFRIWDGKQHIVGYIEAKDPNVDLNRAENSEQLERYLDTFPNLILTNFLEFRLFRNGELIDKCSLGHSIPQHLHAATIAGLETDLVRVLEKLMAFSRRLNSISWAIWRKKNSPISIPRLSPMGFSSPEPLRKGNSTESLPMIGYQRRWDFSGTYFISSPLETCRRRWNGSLTIFLRF